MGLCSLHDSNWLYHVPEGKLPEARCIDTLSLCMPLCFSAAHVHRLIEMGRTWSIWSLSVYKYIRSHIVAWELKAQSFSRHKWFPTCSCKGRIWDATSSSLQPSLTLIVRATLFGVSVEMHFCQSALLRLLHCLEEVANWVLEELMVKPFAPFLALDSHDSLSH
jgi:hypothetical protein